MVFHWRLGHSESPPISRTSKNLHWFSQCSGVNGLDSFSHLQLTQFFFQNFETVPSASTKTSITTIFQFYCFLFSNILCQHWLVAFIKDQVTRLLSFSRTLLRILTDLTTVAETISMLLQMFSYSILFEIVPVVPTMIGTTVTFMFPKFLSSLAMSWFLSRFSLSFSLCDLFLTAKYISGQVIFFSLIMAKQALQLESLSGGRHVVAKIPTNPQLLSLNSQKAENYFWKKNESQN